MITSKQILRLFEDWMKTIINSRNGRELQLYENPSSSDYIKLIKAAKEDGQRKLDIIRFIVTANPPKVYVWDAYVAIHGDISKIINVTYDKNPNVIAGEASFSGGRAIMTDGWRLYRSSVEGKNWSWVDKYILVTPYIKKSIDNDDLIG